MGNPSCTNPELENEKVMGAMMREVFPSIEKLSRRDGNHVLFAFAEKRVLAETVSRLMESGGPAWVGELAQKAAGDIDEFEPRAGAVIFTDDQAPIEEITRRILMETVK